MTFLSENLPSQHLLIIISSSQQTRVCHVAKSLKFPFQSSVRQSSVCKPVRLVFASFVQINIQYFESSPSSLSLPLSFFVQTSPSHQPERLVRLLFYSQVVTEKSIGLSSPGWVCSALFAFTSVCELNTVSIRSSSTPAVICHSTRFFYSKKKQKLINFFKNWFLLKYKFVGS